MQHLDKRNAVGMIVYNKAEVTGIRKLLITVNLSLKSHPISLP